MPLERHFNDTAAPSPVPGELAAVIVVDTGSADFWLNLKANKAAIEAGYIEAAADLLARGADINEKNSQGQTMLLLASKLGLENLVRFLIRKGAALEERDNKGRGFKAISWAVRGSYPGIVRQLIEAGADPDIACSWKTTLYAPKKRFSTGEDTHAEMEIINDMLARAPEIRQRAIEERIRVAHETATRKRKSLQAHAPKIEVGHGPGK